MVFWSTLRLSQVELPRCLWMVSRCWTLVNESQLTNGVVAIRSCQTAGDYWQQGQIKAAFFHWLLTASGCSSLSRWWRCGRANWGYIIICANQSGWAIRKHEPNRVKCIMRRSFKVRQPTNQRHSQRPNNEKKCSTSTQRFHSTKGNFYAGSSRLFLHKLMGTTEVDPRAELELINH